MEGVKDMIRRWKDKRQNPRPVVASAVQLVVPMPLKCYQQRNEGQDSEILLQLDCRKRGL